MKTVTYKGPSDPADPTTRFWSADQRFCLPIGVPLAGIPDDVAAELKATEGHNFEVQSSKGGAATKSNERAKREKQED